MLTKIRIPLDPQPKYGMPFPILGDATLRFYSGNPSCPKFGPIFRYAWCVPSTLDPHNISIEEVNGIYEWVGYAKAGAEGAMSERLTDEQLRAIEARYKASTEGVWYWGEGNSTVLCNAGIVTATKNIFVNCGRSSGEPSDEDRDLLANAHQDIPALLAEIRALREEVRLAQEHYGLPAKEQRSYPPPNLLENAS